MIWIWNRICYEIRTKINSERDASKKIQKISNTQLHHTSYKWQKSKVNRNWEPRRIAQCGLDRAELSCVTKSRFSETKTKALSSLGGSQGCPLWSKAGSLDATLEVTLHRKSSRRKRIHGTVWDPRWAKENQQSLGVQIQMQMVLCSFIWQCLFMWAPFQKTSGPSLHSLKYICNIFKRKAHWFWSLTDTMWQDTRRRHSGLSNKKRADANRPWDTT